MTEHAIERDRTVERPQPAPSGRLERIAIRGGRLVRLLRIVVSLHLLLVLGQGVTAGMFLSGDGRAVQGHQVGAMVIMALSLIQVILAVSFWRLGGGPGWFVIASLAVFVMEILQMGLGRNLVFWAHVPLGVALFGGLTRQQVWIMGIRRSPGGSPIGA